jgi:hypothetical protein
MITNAPIPLFAESTLADVNGRSHGLVAWFLGWVQQSLCALHGHDAILQYERNRMFLRCTSCGHETPGWEVSANSTMARHRPLEPARPSSLATPRDLAVARRIA